MSRSALNRDERAAMNRALMAGIQGSGRMTGYRTAEQMPSAPEGAGMAVYPGYQPVGTVGYGYQMYPQQMNPNMVAHQMYGAGYGFVPETPGYMPETPGYMPETPGYMPTDPQSAAAAAGGMVAGTGVDDSAYGGGKKSKEFPMHGDKSTYNLNRMLKNNIMESDYFKALYELKTYHEVIEEIYERVTHVAFCLLMKMFTLRLTYKQVSGLLRDKKSPYVRAIGLLYLRYVCPPKDLWSWVEPYLDDYQSFAPTSNPSINMTMGQYVRKLISDMQYHGTTLPRIPVLIERRMKVKLLLHEEKIKRARANEAIKAKLQRGVKVKAIYEDEDNDPAWYDATIVSVEDGDKYNVTFDYYENTEIVTLGEIQLIEGEEEKEDDRSGKGGDKGDDHDDARRRGEESSSRRKEGKEYDEEGEEGEEDEYDDPRSRPRPRSRSYRRDDDDEDGEDDRSRRRSRDRDGGRRYGSHSSERSRDRRRRRSESSERSPRKKHDDRQAVKSGQSLINKDLMEAVIQKDRERSAAEGKMYAQRPASYKGSLSLKLDRYTHRKRSRSRSPPPPSRSRPRSSNVAEKPSEKVIDKPSSPKKSSGTTQRLQELKKHYGDASAGASASGNTGSGE